jgi:hypothetical protein
VRETTIGCFAVSTRAKKTTAEIAEIHASVKFAEHPL